MSRIVAITPCRNEAWCLGLSARALLMWVDHLIILNHASTDDTWAIIAALIIEYGHDRVSCLEDPDPTWHEMQQRQRLLDAARFADATHVVTIDCDEVLTGDMLPLARRWVELLKPGAVMQYPWLQLRDGIDTVISSGMWAQQFASCAFLDQPAFHWKAMSGYDHHHRQPMGMSVTYGRVLSYNFRTGGLMHLQMASKRRLLWKHLHYKLTERLRWPERTAESVNAMYDRTVNECQGALVASVKESWWEPYAHLMEFLDVDAEPWQEAAAKRLIAEHPKLLEGLTTYGLL